MLACLRHLFLGGLADWKQSDRTLLHLLGRQGERDQRHQRVRATLFMKSSGLSQYRHTLPVSTAIFQVIKITDINRRRGPLMTTPHVHLNDSKNCDEPRPLTHKKTAKVVCSFLGQMLLFAPGVCSAHPPAITPCSPPSASSTLYDLALPCDGCTSRRHLTQASRNMPESDGSAELEQDVPLAVRLLNRATDRKSQMEPPPHRPDPGSMDSSQSTSS